MMTTRRLPVKLVSLLLALLYVGLAVVSLKRGNSLLIGIVLVLLSFVPFLLRFERRERLARELVLLAVLAAVASISRVPFAALLPNFTPVTFIVILSGTVFGAEAGWMVGAMTALVSNLFIGQGPWTPWQMFAWGMAGYTAGLVAHRFPFWRKRLPLALFGVAWGFLFNWILNVTIVLDFWTRDHSWKAIEAVYAGGLTFDLVHAGANLFFLLSFGPAWIALLERYKRKYGALRRIRLEEGSEDAWRQNA